MTQDTSTTLWATLRQHQPVVALVLICCLLVMGVHTFSLFQNSESFRAKRAAVSLWLVAGPTLWGLFQPLKQTAKPLRGTPVLLAALACAYVVLVGVTVSPSDPQPLTAAPLFTALAFLIVLFAMRLRTPS